MINYKDCVKILVKHGNDLGIDLLVKLIDEFSAADQETFNFGSDGILKKIDCGINIPKVCQK